MFIFFICSYDLKISISAMNFRKLFWIKATKIKMLVRGDLWISAKSLIARLLLHDDQIGNTSKLCYILKLKLKLLNILIIVSSKNMHPINVMKYC